MFLRGTQREKNIVYCNQDQNDWCKIESLKWQAMLETMYLWANGIIDDW